jgi:hypothetical protein
MLEDLVSAILGLLLAAALGAYAMHEYMDNELQQLTRDYNIAYVKANKAKSDAEAHAETVERNQAAAITNAIDNYKANNEIDKARADAVITDLRNDITRLRVRTNHPAACGGQVPSAAAGTGGPAGTGDETLAGPVAARLAGRYADYNRIVEKLTACQAVIQADRLLTN